MPLPNLVHGIQASENPLRYAMDGTAQLTVTTFPSYYDIRANITPLS